MRDSALFSTVEREGHLFGWISCWVEEHLVYMNSAEAADSKTSKEFLVTSMNFIGLDSHKKTISYCVKDISGKVLSEGKIPAAR